MNTWWQLSKKEFRLGLPAFLFTLIGLVAVLTLAFYLGTRAGSGDHEGLQAVKAASMLLITAHILYLLCYMVYSLQSERKKLHLWLASPLPGSVLLSAKLVNGLLAMTVTLSISSAVGLITTALLHDLPKGYTWGTLFANGGFIILNIYLMSIFFALCFVFFWMIYRMLLRRLGGVTSGVITGLFAWLLSYLTNLFEKTELYHAIVRWGKISSPSILNQTGISSGHIYLGVYIWYTVIAVVLFAASCWILDKKVEV
jgi:hypothetical protein